MTYFLGAYLFSQGVNYFLGTGFYSMLITQMIFEDHRTNKLFCSTAEAGNDVWIVLNRFKTIINLFILFKCGTKVIVMLLLCCGCQFNYRKISLTLPVNLT